MDTTVPIGGTAAFNVVATSGTTMSYQWLKNGVNISGASQSKYIIPQATPADEGLYSVRVSNAGGSVTSSSATLTVVGDPVGCSGQTACVSATNGATRTWSHTVSGGANRILVVGIALADTGRTVSGVTYGGTPLSRITSSRIKNTVEMWSLLAPPVGTADIVAMWAGNEDMAGWSGTFTNVDQTAPIRNSAVASGNTTTPGVTLSSVAGDLVVDTLSANGDAQSLSVGADQTQICQNTTGTGGGDCWGAASYQPGGGSVTMSWLAGDDKDWDLAAIVLKAAPHLQADVTASVTGPGSVIAGANLTYTITVTNAGPAAALNITLTDTLPADASLFTTSGGGTFTNGAVIWPSFNLAANDSTSFTVSATAPGSGILTNAVSSTAATYDPDASNNNGSASGAQVVTTVTPQGSPALVGPGDTAWVTAKDVATRAWPHTVSPGNNRILVVGIALADTSESVSGVTFGGVALSPITSSRIRNTVGLWALLAPPVGTANIVATWTGKKAMVGWSGTFTNVDQSSPIRNSAVAAGNDSTPSLTVAAAAGDLVVDTLSANGDAKSLTVSTGQTQIFQDQTGTGGGDCWGAASFKPGAASVSMSWRAGDNKDWDLTAMVLRAAPPPQADVTISLNGPTNVASGSVFTHTVSVANHGPRNATNLIVNDILPAGVTLVGVSGGGMAAKGVVTWALPSLASTAVVNFTVALRTSTAGRFTNTVIARADTSDPDPANNSSSLITTATNTAPVADNQSVTTPGSTPIALSLTGSDANNDLLTFVLGTLPLNGSVSGFDPTSGALTYTPNPDYTGTDSFTFVVCDGLTNSSPATVSITVTPIPPGILTQPRSQTVAVGQSASFSVVASGTAPLGYQWSLNGGVVSGATGSTLLLEKIQQADAGSYTVIVTNPWGLVVSAPATLTVLTPPIAVTLGTSEVTSESAVLQGAVDPQGQPTICYFEYGASTNYGSVSPPTPVAAGTLNAAAAVAARITGLTAGMVYHYRVVATNSSGVTFGNDATFTTVSAAPLRLDAKLTGPGGHMQLSLTGASGTSYTVLTAPSPGLPLRDWVVLGSMQEITPGQYQFIDPRATTRTQCHYQVRSP